MKYVDISYLPIGLDYYGYISPRNNFLCFFVMEKLYLLSIRTEKISMDIMVYIQKNKLLLVYKHQKYVMDLYPMKKLFEYNMNCFVMEKLFLLPIGTEKIIIDIIVQSQKIKVLLVFKGHGWIYQWRNCFVMI